MQDFSLGLLVASSVGVILGFIIGFFTGRSTSPMEIPVYDGGLTGNYAVHTPHGIEIMGTQSANPATSWSLFMKARPVKMTLKQWKRQGFRAKRVK